MKSLKKTDPPFPRNHQLPINLQLGVGFHEPSLQNSCVRILVSLVLCGSSAYSLVYEFMCENIPVISGKHTFTAVVYHVSFCLLFLNDPWVLEGGDMIWMLHSAMVCVTFPLLQEDTYLMWEGDCIKHPAWSNQLKESVLTPFLCSPST